MHKLWKKLRTAGPLLTLMIIIHVSRTLNLLGNILQTLAHGITQAKPLAFGVHLKNETIAEFSWDLH